MNDERVFCFKEIAFSCPWEIIIITSDVADLIRPTVDRFLFSESFPLVVEIPSAGGKSPDLRTLVNDAIGVSI